jgi:hypothetical protein
MVTLIETRQHHRDLRAVIGDLRAVVGGEGHRIDLLY